MVGNRTYYFAKIEGRMEYLGAAYLLEHTVVASYDFPVFLSRRHLLLPTSLLPSSH